MIILCDGCGKTFDNGSLICPFCGEANMEYEDSNRELNQFYDEQEYELEFDHAQEDIFADSELLLENDFH